MRQPSRWSLFGVVAIAAAASAAPSQAALGGALDGRIGVSWTADPTPREQLVSWKGTAAIRLQPGRVARGRAVRALKRAGQRVDRRWIQGASFSGVRSVEELSCSDSDGNEHIQRREAGRIVRPLTPFEFPVPARLNLLTGRGRMAAAPVWREKPYPSAAPFYLPVEPRIEVTANEVPCRIRRAGDGAGGVYEQSIFSPSGDEVMPWAFAVWINEHTIRLRRAKGVWRARYAGRYRDSWEVRIPVTLSYRIDLRLRGTPRSWGAVCHFPEERIERMRSVRAALRLARRAGYPDARYAGTHAYYDTPPGRLIVEDGGVYGSRLCGTRGGPRIYRSR